MKKLAGSLSQDRGGPSEEQIVAALLICNASTPLTYLEMCDLIIINLRCTPQVTNIKKYTNENSNIAIKTKKINVEMLFNVM